MASDVSKVHVEACLFLYRIVVAVATDPQERPPRMLHNLPLKLVVARMSPSFLKRDKQYAIAKQNLKHTIYVIIVCSYLNKQHSRVQSA